MRLLQRYQNWLHVVGWAVFIGLPFLMFPGYVWSRSVLLSFGVTKVIEDVLLIVFFYVNLWFLTPTFLQQRNLRRFVLGLLLAFGVVLAIDLLVLNLFPPNFPQPPSGAGMGQGRHHWPGPPPANYILGIRVDVGRLTSTVVSFGFVGLLGSLIAFSQHHDRVREAQQQMTLEKVSAELAMLKLQVSPHFLFNTLNNIRWLARQKSDQTEEAIVTLSQLLRYMIYRAQHDKVPLRQELDHLADYVALQQMRLKPNQSVTFTHEGDIDSYDIEPLLFIPFVENAFKYGLHSQQASQIDIRLSVVGDTLTFFAENPMFEQPRPDDVPMDSGIGILNVEKRLALHYPNRHTLQINPEADRFRVILTLQLHHDEVALHRH
ncbi:Inner membrane protein ypdA [Fibrisoma limi BUZ 3]|uniref:Inner membrane protein ypdA n=1 Tax=Fibrisoma limi BUZ 3 TaxID=1185876 RepID=I2GIL4_9BACT|nr:sensor histidine kinase [Fibrisoma limi]CCH53739.1 Inner membrane protein ypdA [Fibrisoma limi BUZ 3]